MGHAQRPGPPSAPPGDRSAMGHTRWPGPPSAPPGDPPPSASASCTVPGAPLPPPDLVAWWLAPSGGPPPRVPGDPVAWLLAPPGGPHATATMCPAPHSDPPPPRAATMTCSARAPAHPGGPPAPPDAATRWR
jgi:hypothetical protein